MTDFTADDVLDLGHGIRVRAVDVSGVGAAAQRAGTVGPARDAEPNIAEDGLESAGADPGAAVELARAIAGAGLRLEAAVELPALLNRRRGSVRARSSRCGGAPAGDRSRRTAGRRGTGAPGGRRHRSCALAFPDSAGRGRRRHQGRWAAALRGPGRSVRRLRLGRRAGSERASGLRRSQGAPRAALPHPDGHGLGGEQGGRRVGEPVPSLPPVLGRSRRKAHRGRRPEPHRPTRRRTVPHADTRTFSRGTPTFARLFSDADLFRALHERYAGRVLVFDHPSVHVAPAANAAWLRAQLPSDREVDLHVLAHSRGGLVARHLAAGRSRGDPGARRGSQRGNDPGQQGEVG